MTLLDAIKTNEMFVGLSDDMIQLMFDVRGFDSRAVADESSLKNLELITADLYSEMMTKPNFSEGGLSITYDKASMKAYIERVAKKYNDTKLDAVIGGAIRDISETW